MKKSLEGISQIIRVTRTPLSIVAIAMIGLMALIFGILVFAPIPNIAKYVVAGVCLALLATVWFQFWNKAKHEPLSATEEYHIQALRLRHIGADNKQTSIEQSESDPRLPRGEVQQSAKRDEKDNRQP